MSDVVTYCCARCKRVHASLEQRHGLRVCYQCRGIVELDPTWALLLAMPPRRAVKETST